MMMHTSQALRGNPLYQKHKWQIYDHEFHLHKIRTSKHYVDDNPPRTFMHLFVNLKRIQQEQERISYIQRENKYLLDRIADILRGPGFVDHRNEYEPKSLNCWKRQNDMVRLAYENLAQHRRILDVHPNYNHNRLQDSFMLHKKYKANVCKYPANWKELLREEEAMRQEIRENFLRKEERLRKGRKEFQEKKKRMLASPKSATSSSSQRKQEPAERRSDHRVSESEP